MFRATPLYPCGKGSSSLTLVAMIWASPLFPNGTGSSSHAFSTPEADSLQAYHEGKRSSFVIRSFRAYHIGQPSPGTWRWGVKQARSSEVQKKYSCSVECYAWRQEASSMHRCAFASVNWLNAQEPHRLAKHIVDESIFASSAVYVVIV